MKQHHGMGPRVEPEGDKGEVTVCNAAPSRVTMVGLIVALTSECDDGESRTLPVILGQAPALIRGTKIGRASCRERV